MNTIKLSLLSVMLFLSSFIQEAFAQAPQKFNYQGIARDAKGNPMSLQQLSLKLSVLPASDATVPEYEETQLVTTNEFGLYTLQIGNGTVLSGAMKNVKWETGNKYIKVGIDVNGGSNYADAGTSQLLSVPYAIYADKAGTARETAGGGHDTRAGAVVTAPATTGDLNMVPKFNGTANTITNSQIIDNGTNVGIGTTTPATALHIKKAGTTYLTIQSDATNSTAALRIQDSTGLGGELGISKFGTNTGGSFMGVPRKSMGVINNLTGPFLFNVGGYCIFGQTVGVNQRARMMVDSATGRVAIGNDLSSLPTIDGRLDVRDALGNTLLGNFQNTSTAGNRAALIRMRNANPSTTAWLYGVGGNGNTNGLTAGQFYIEQEGASPRLMINTSGNVGIGTTTPTASLDVNGQIRMQGGSPGAGKFMISDATGIGSWTTATGAGLLSGSGTNNYMTKFAPNGTTLGSSSVFDSAGYIRLNANNSASNNNSAVLLKAPATKFNLFSFENRGTTNTGNRNTYLSIMDSLRFDATTTNFKALLLGQSDKINNGSFSDSLGAVTLNPYNKLHVGGFLGQGLLFNLQTGKMSNGTINDLDVSSNAHFSINSGYDTAGYFSSTTNVTSTDGILRSEYLGSSVTDHVAIYGKSVPGTDFYGIGVVGEGGYKGVQAYSSISNGGGNTGVHSTAISNDGAVGVSGYATYNTLSTVGSKVGVSGVADGGDIAIGVQAFATSASTNYGVYASAPIGGGNRAGLFNGDLQVIGNLSKSGGTFKIDHPNDPENKYLIHSFVESPDMMNIYNGNIVTDANGDALVTMPDYFKSLNTDFRYQLTVIGTFAQAIIAEKMNGNTFKIKTSLPNVEVSWMVTGVRKDPYAIAHPIVPELEKETANKGLYLNPAEYGQPQSKGIFSSMELQRAEKEKQDKAIHEKANAKPGNKINDEKRAVGNPALMPGTTK